MALPDYPITRNDQYLSRIAGEGHPIPDYPITREEQYLAAIAEGGGGGGGLPPVTGSGKALVSVNGQWKQQEGFPYDEGETVTTLFDETFSGFTRGMEEHSHSIHPIETSDPDNVNNVIIGGVTYYYVDDSVHDYNDDIVYCEVRNQDWQTAYPSGWELIESGAVKKCELSYSIDQYDPETGEPTDPLIGTLYGVYAPTDGAQDADGNTFPAAGFYCTVNGDLSGSFVGVNEIGLNYPGPSDQWISEHSVDMPLPNWEDGKNYRVYVDGEVAESGEFDDWINFEGGYVYTEDDGEGNYKAKCNLYADSYETAPENISIKLEEIDSGLHKLDHKYIEGQTLPDASHLDNGTAMIVVDGEWKKQEWYGYKFRDWNEVFSDSVGFSSEEKRSFTYVLIAPQPELDSPETGKLRILIDGDEFIVIPTYVGGNNSWLYAVPKKNFAFLWSNLDSQYFEYTGEIQEGEEVSFTVSIECYQEQYDTMDSRYIPWNSAPVGTGLPEPTYEDGTYILQATESDGEMEYAWSKADTKAMVVTYDDDTTETFNVLIRPTE